MNFDAHIYGPFFSSLGVGISTRAFWKLLTLHGLKVGIWPQSNPIGDFEKTIANKYKEFIVQNEHPKLNFFRINADEISRSPISRMSSTAAINLLVPFWETSHLPSVWHLEVQKFSGVVAATTFIASAFSDAIRDKPIFVFTHPIEVEKVSSEESSVLQTFSTQSYFLYSFAYSSYVSRKQPEKFLELAEIYRHVNLASSSTFILASGDKPKSETDHKVAERFRKSESRSFKYLEGPRDRLQHISLMQNADLFVSMHRSEGIGLQLAESVLLDTPVVSHTYSGPSDFLSEDIPGNFGYNLVDIKLGEYPEVFKDYWAEFDLHEVIRAMDIALAAEPRTNNQIKDKVSSHFSLERNCVLLDKMLKDLLT